MSREAIGFDRSFERCYFYDGRTIARLLSWRHNTWFYDAAYAEKTEKGSRRPYICILLVIFGILVVVLPILGIGAAVIEDAGNLAEDLEESEAINTTQIEQRLAEYTGQNFDIETSLDSFVSTFTNTTLGGFSQIVTTLTEIAIGVTLLIFLLYYLS